MKDTFSHTPKSFYSLFDTPKIERKKTFGIIHLDLKTPSRYHAKKEKDGCNSERLTQLTKHSDKMEKLGLDILRYTNRS